ncbi:hypothetical protein L1049_007066 [Liquidambar formosana]|uniref:Uncharacterized protein n=1 Tax=Liquidambar formosana TaxID=63359 RepID=A0AAP0WRU0_LIQFO
MGNCTCNTRYAVSSSSIIGRTIVSCRRTNGGWRALLILSTMVGVFEVGVVPFNPNGWGPPNNSNPLSNHPTNVPFTPFSCSDKLSRIID